MSEELEMAEKLELLRKAMPRGIAAGYESAGEKTPVQIQTVEFQRNEVHMESSDSGGVGTPLNPPQPGPTGSKKHPWEMSPKSTNTIYVSKGFLLGYYLDYAGASSGFPATSGMFYPDYVVVGPIGNFAGDELTITGTQYVYALYTNNGPINEYAEAMAIDASDKVGVELFDMIEPSGITAVTIVASNNAPSAYVPAAGKTAVCIGLVTNTAGVCTIDEQYVTTNEKIFVPVVNVNIFFPS